MPTYDYACQACEHTFEAFHSMTAKPLRKCPACGKLKLKRLIGIGAGVIFKGSGFYETDYRSDSYKKAAKADSQSKTSDTASSSSSGSDSAAGSSSSGGGSAETSGGGGAKATDSKPAAGGSSGSSAAK